MRFSLIPGAALLLLAGCAHRPFEPNADTVALAQHAYPYAVLALNAYGEDWVDLGDGVKMVEDCGNDNRGYAYSVFEVKRGSSVETVIAFRGTEGKNPINQDWLFGNWGRTQQPRAVATARRIAAESGTGPLTYVGHSLGGGLAIEASFNVIEDGLKVYSFNGSPRFLRPRGTDDSGVERYSIVERGEVLYVGRTPSNEATQQYNSLNCTRGFSPFRDHAMLRLASCLTRIAADAGDARAASLLTETPGPRMLKNNAEPRPVAPCFHHRDIPRA